MQELSDGAPANTSVWDEQEVPEKGLAKPRKGKKTKFNPSEHKAHTRRWLALTALAVLVALDGTLLVLFATGTITMEDLTALIAAFSGLHALAGISFGFYFAKS